MGWLHHGTDGLPCSLQPWLYEIEIENNNVQKKNEHNIEKENEHVYGEIVHGGV